MSVVILKHMPKARTVHTFRYPALNGGINIRDAEINLNDNESPEIVNLWWEDGVLQSRPGQERVTAGWGAGSDSGQAFDASDEVYAAAQFPGGVIVHIGSALYAWHGDFQELRRVSGETSVPRNPGTFFRYKQTLYYKNRGGFYRLTSSENLFTLSEVTDDAYTPTILVNANPATGSGDIYQPENALSPCKRVTYNANTTPETVVKTANGTARFFSLGKTAASDNLRGVRSVYINDAYTEPALYQVDTATGTVLFSAAPPDGAVITFTLDIGNREYHLPVELSTANDSTDDGTDDGTDDDSTDDVIEVRLLSGASALTLVRGRDYTVDKAAGIVTFTEAPPVTDPPTNNTVEITYRKANTTAMDAVMNCPYATVYGTGKELCVLLGGNSDNPNAVYWSGNTSYGPDIGYWPVINYNLVDGEITGFGKQYDQMFVFQKDRIGKFELETENINGRDTVSLLYSGVNDAIGCDLPRSIQLIENNLTFANTSGGVYQVLSASAAYENNVQCISNKINGSNIRPGLLSDLALSGSVPVCSLDDGKRYWLAVNGAVWLWDYSISRNSNPVWFHFTEITPYALSMRDKAVCLFNADRETVRLSGQIFDDFGTPFRKVYQFPVRNFGSYDRLKDVLTLIVSARADTPADIKVIYETDYESRADRINLSSPGYDRLTDRNLEVRDLSVPRHAVTFRRAPNCQHVRHFALRFEADADTPETGHNLALFSVELQYRFVGRDR